jgi:L-methionine (R)-S-oxide reductase
MFEASPIEAATKAELYRELGAQLRGLLAGERDAVANLANASALLHGALPDLNWAGFYLLASEGELVVGPFQGRPACTRIPIGRGVCGTAVAEGRAIVVEDVHAFPGHIACDAASRSELVVPIRGGDGSIVGVVDLDSPVPARFDAADREGVEQLAAILGEGCDWAPPSSR